MPLSLNRGATACGINADSASSFWPTLSFGYFPLDCNDYPATVFLVLSLAGSLVPSFGHAGQFLSVSQAARSHQCLSAPV